MYVIRVEHKSSPSIVQGYPEHVHSGAYGASITLGERVHSCVAAALNNVGSTIACSHQPMPYSDDELQRDLDVKDLHQAVWMYCFMSMEQYHRWFNNPATRSKCASVGRLAVYDVPLQSVGLGSSQCIADAREARLVDILPLDYTGDMPV